MKLHALLDDGLVLPRLEARDRTGVLREMAARLEARHAPGLDDSLLDKLLKREELGTTAIGKGVAVPHCRAKGLTAPALLLGLSPDGVAFDAVDGKPSHVFFLLVSPEDNPGAGLRLLAAIAGLVRRSRGLSSKLIKAPTPEAIIGVLQAEEEKPRA
ncbi:MAG: PTS sugar transporter subunit IIA [Candidatus Aminicenantes bacterium]|jgi:PTS system nitrogen regulatory IIA component|nr:PTS sugar transporter subunit IIA [Candidatus Aminicenantes bacterium]